MIGVSANQNILVHAVNIEKHVLEFDDMHAKHLSAGALPVNAGNAVTIDSYSNGGKLILATTDTKVFGISRMNMNSTCDEVTGATGGGTYGSGIMTIVCKGICTLRPGYFQNLKGEIIKIPSYDDINITPTTDPMSDLYITSSGVITTVQGAVGTSKCWIGYLIIAPTTSNEAIQIYLDC